MSRSFVQRHIAGHLQRQLIVLWVVWSITSSSAMGAEPNLKAGVMLTLGASQSEGWAAPDVVDWNNDGLNDVIVGHYSGAVRIYLNRGIGKKGIQFEEVAINRRDGFAIGGKPIWAWRFNITKCVCPGPGRVSPRVVDWDNDGKKDLVIGDGRGAHIRIWRNIGTENTPVFSTRFIQYLPPDAGVRPYHETVQPYIADWNGDGKNDLIMGRNRGVYVYLNEGTHAAPNFAFDRSRLGTKIRDVFPTERLCPVVVDWDNDGKKDLVVGSQQGEVRFARNIGSKTRPAFSGYSRAKAGGKNIQVKSEARIAVADLDGDGHDDLVVGDGGGEVWLFQASNPNPVARSRHVRVKHGRAAPVKLIGTDDSGRTLTFAILTQPKHGALSGNAPNLSYTPKENYQGSDRFTFKVAAGKVSSAPAAVMVEVRPPAKQPTITTQPSDIVSAIGQPVRFRVAAAGTPPFSYTWKRNGKVIYTRTRKGKLVPKATGPEFFIREAKAEDSAKYSVTVKNAEGIVSSRAAVLQVKPLPKKTDDVPVIGIKFKSPSIEPSTPGVITLSRSGNTAQPMSVQLTFRYGHNPVVADMHYVRLPSSIMLKAGQTTAEVQVTPIDDTLATGTQTLTFLVVPSPLYRIASKYSRVKMSFLDDDCPHIGISVVKDAKLNSTGRRFFQVTAQPAPRRDTQISYSVGGTAIPGVDYEKLTGSVTIPAGKTVATIVIKPYKQKATVPASEKKTVVLTLPQHRFTYFDFYKYLTEGRPRTARVQIASTKESPTPPKRSESTEDVAITKLRGEVSRLGWIYFAARSNGSNSDFDLFVMRPDGSHLRNITNTPKFDEFSARVSAGGKKILYRRVKTGGKFPSSDRTQQDVGTRAIRTWPQTGTLVIANADGSSPKPLGDGGAYAWATWGPKGNRIACLESVDTKDAGANKTAKKPRPSYKIVIRDVKTMKVIKSMRSAGIYGQATWSPNGKWICGPANILPGKTRLGRGIEYPIGLGKMVSVNIDSGKRIAMARFPDWSPVWATDSDGDWFQGGTPQVLHSANNYGICPSYYAMLWRSGLQGKPSELVFGEYQKHIWGGCTSPNDKYAIFVIGGNTWPLQGKMAVIRLADAPIARGSSPLFHELLADLFPNLKKGPILDLPHVREGFDPHWAMAEIGADSIPKK